jgi:hypothetical protein
LTLSLKTLAEIQPLGRAARTTFSHCGIQLFEIGRHFSVYWYLRTDHFLPAENPILIICINHNK